MKQKIRQFKKSLPWSSSPVFRNCLIIVGIILAIFIIAVIVHLNQTRPSTTSQPSSEDATTSKPTTQPESSTKTEPGSKSETPKPKSQTTTPEATQKTPETTQKAPESTAQPEPTPTPVSQPEPVQPETPAITPQPETATPKCWHSVAGRCYDGLEEEAAAAGYYDHLNGEYEGRSFDVPDDCDAVCQDILEEAYYEGYYDY